MKKQVRKIYYTIFIVLLSIRRILFTYNVWEIVKLKNGKLAYLTQGVNKPHWNLSEIETMKYHIGVHQSEFHNYWNLKNLIGTFTSCYQFYKNNWLDIWVRNGIEDWCKRCDIW